MNQIRKAISSGDSNTGGTVSGSVTVQLQHVFILIKQLQTSISNRDTSGFSSLLQKILAQLKSIQSIASSSINQLIIQITSKITQLQQQIQSGKANINSIKIFIQVIMSPYMYNNYCAYVQNLFYIRPKSGTCY